jgi:caffeoyl-CoA O-methyltransferase
MSSSTLNLSQELYSYLQNVSLREPELLRQLREETASHPMAMMQISPEQGQFMGLLIRLLQARKTLEIGVFTGYSSLSVALALPRDGKLIACDLRVDFTDIAKRYWEKAGVKNKIDLRLAPALETLDQLLANGEAESFDFAFIDADKCNYVHYYERCLKLIRSGGLISIDNVLWSGRVLEKNTSDEDTQAIQKLNELLHHDERITLSMLPIGDGLTLALKK